MEAAHIAWRPLGRVLVEQGLLTDDELERALAQQQTTGRRLGETIVELGFVSSPDLASALATQYGIELTMETGFGTGLRAEIQRRHESDRRLPGPPTLSIVDTPQPEPEADPVSEHVEQPDAGEALLLTQLEEQWAKLAAAEASLSESEREIAALTLASNRRREQAVRFVQRIREREQRLQEQHEELDELRHTFDASLAEGAQEIAALTRAGNRRRKQAFRFMQRMREREQRLQEQYEELDELRRAFDASLAEREQEIAALRRAGDHRRRQTVRFLSRVRERERRLAEQLDELGQLGRLTEEQVNAIERLAGDVRGCDAEIERLNQVNGRLRAQAARFATRLRRGREQPDHIEAAAPMPSSHLVFVQLDGGYELVESDGPAPALNTVLELPQLCEQEFVVTRLGRSPLPADPRACVFVQRF